MSRRVGFMVRYRRRQLRRCRSRGCGNRLDVGPAERVPRFRASGHRDVVVMQERGVEPLHLSVQAPKTCASANSATPAVIGKGGFSTILSTVSNEVGLGGNVGAAIPSRREGFSDQRDFGGGIWRVKRASGTPTTLVIRGALPWGSMMAMAQRAPEWEGAAS